MTHKAADDLKLPLPGLRLAGCLVDHGLGCQFEGASGRTYLHIEGWIRYTTAEGSSPELSALDHQAAGLAKRMMGRVVKSAVAHSDGDLTIVFEDASKLSVEADREYHAWELLASTGEKIVCGPGGKLTISQIQFPAAAPPASDTPKP